MQARVPRTSYAVLTFFIMLAAVGELPRAVDADDHDDNVIESFEVGVNGDNLLLPVTIGGHVYQFLLDTGCSRTVFDTSLKNELIPTGNFGHRKGAVVQRLELFECRGATVGKTKLPLAERAVCLDLSEIKRFTRDDVRGVLGMDFLRTYIVQIDY